MQRHLLVILMLLIPIITIVPSGANATTIQNFAGHDYNFTELPLGAFPSNNTWIGFTHTAINSYSSIETARSAPGTGLNVSIETYGSESAEYLLANASVFNTTTLKITFSWNDSYDLVSTVDNFLISQDGYSLLHYYFGPASSSQQYLWGAFKRDLGDDFAKSAYYTIEISWNKAVPGMAFFSIVPGYNATGNFPIPIELNSSMVGGHLLISFGGYNANLTLYNIYMTRGNMGFNVPGAESFNYTITKSKNLTGVSGTVIDPFPDTINNDVLFLQNGSYLSLRYWNYENGTAGTLANFRTIHNGKILELENSTIYGFVYANGTSLSMALLNLASLKISEMCTNGSFPSFFSAFPLFNQLILLANGSIFVLNLTERNWKVLSVGGKDYTPVQASITNTTVSGIYATDDAAQYLHFSINSSLNLQINSESLNSSIIVGLNSTLQESDSMSVALSNSSDPGWYYLVLGSNTTEIINDHLDFYAGSHGMSYLSTDKGISYLTGSGIIDTNVNVENLSGLWINSNASLGVASNQSTLFLFYRNGIPLSPYTINISVEKVGVVTGNISLPYSVSSSLAYSVKAYLNGSQLMLNRSDVLLNISSFKSGNYMLTLKAENSAGYYTQFFEYITIDKEKPGIDISPGNGSYVAHIENFHVDILNVTQGGSAEISASGFNQTYTGTLFNFSVESNPGKFKIWVNYTDVFGMVHSRWFEFISIVTGESNGKLSVANGSYLSSGNIRLGWVALQNTSYYLVNITSSGPFRSLEVNANETGVNLSNGKYSVTVVAFLLDGQWRSVGETNFTVENFPPTLSVSHTESYYFSFSRNSFSDNLQINATTNISSQIVISIKIGTDQIFRKTFSGKEAHLDLNRSTSPFFMNGIYKVYVNASGPSGLHSLYSFPISVNNSFPQLPDVNSSVIYTNSTLVKFGLHPQSNVSYSEKLRWGNQSIIRNLSGSSLILPEANTTYNVTVMAESQWGATDSANFGVITYSERPVINITTANTMLTTKPFLNITYTVSDHVPVNISFYLTNGTIIKMTQAKRGNLSIRFRSDGSYDLTVTAYDICGNVNTAWVRNITVEYYPVVRSIGIGIFMLMGFGKLSAIISGQYLQNLNYKWRIGSSTYTGPSIPVFLLPGYHTITLTATFDNSTYIASERIFIIGFIPEASAIIGLTAAFIAVRRTYDDDEVKAMQIILSMKGSEVFAIMKELKRNRIRKSTGERKLKEIVSSGKAALLKDPDGVMYLMDAGKFRE